MAITGQQQASLVTKSLDGHEQARGGHQSSSRQVQRSHLVTVQSTCLRLSVVFAARLRRESEASSAGADRLNDSPAPPVLVRAWLADSVDGV